MENEVRTSLDLTNCIICPHNCKVNREEKPAGKCGTNSAFNIAAISLHKGEEPVISGKLGICNIFFSGCNLKCLFCQNHQISRGNKAGAEKYYSIGEIIDEIERLVSLGAKSVGFVSPSHVLPQVIKIIEGLEKRRIGIVKVYNTNSYEKPESIHTLEGMIDIYLPDFKYMDEKLAYEYSRVRDYPQVALKAIKEMYRQKGSRLFVSDDGVAENGIIIRHLVLPGSIENSLRTLQIIAEEISTNIHISLMSQYYPTEKVKGYALLGRKLNEAEYNEVANKMYSLGFNNGYTQEFGSSEIMKPDFSRKNPFNENMNIC